MAKLVAQLSLYGSNGYSCIKYVQSGLENKYLFSYSSLNTFPLIKFGFNYPSGFGECEKSTDDDTDGADDKDNSSHDSLDHSDLLTRVFGKEYEY
jgi:hypothetical protein